ncbi:MAG TPA: cation:proton antiporter [Actinomycetota bacterium]|nr:cation:proton antiporter [Actinomycetota bacterium]
MELGLVILGLSVLARLALRIGIPPIPLYVIAGLAFGDGGLLPLVTTQEFIRIGAEIGLILLLFMLGLEYPARKLIGTLKHAPRSGGLNIALNFTPGFVAGLLMGWAPLPAAFLGGATYVSSSGVAARLIEDLRIGQEERTPIVSTLILEDLAMAMFLPTIGAFLIGGSAAGSLMIAVSAVAIVILLLLFALRAGTGVSRLVFANADEPLLLSILGFGLLIAGIAEVGQVSAAVGALVAGIVISGPAAQNVRPLLSPIRDLFAAIFFAFVGFSIDPGQIPGALPVALLLAGITGATKFVAGWKAAEWAGVPWPRRSIVGATLLARGEFSLAIAGLAVAARVRPNPAPIIATYVVIMALIGPVVARIVSIRVQRAEAD